MASRGRTGWSWLLVIGVAILLPAALTAADRTEAVDAAPETVELFSAIEAGQVEVRLIPKDSTECRITVKNTTDKPLSVKLPATFGAVHVLAQFDMGAGMGGMDGGRGGRGGGGFGGGQSMGGGMGGMGMGGMGMGMGGGGMWNIAPEKVAKGRFPTVCLEHGKPDPRPSMTYKIVPLDQVTEKAGVEEVCGMLGTGQLNQRVAQAAAWHLANDMSWAELAAKQVRRVTGQRYPYFSPFEIQAGMQAAGVAQKRAEEQQESSYQDSLTQR